MEPVKSSASSHLLLTPKQMARLDSAAVNSGIAASSLMAAASARVYEQIVRRMAPVPTVVLCGPGNNGGDGFYVAHLLRAAGWPVRVALFGAGARLSPGAQWAAGVWGAPVEPAQPQCLDGAGLIIDALFGAGFARAPDAALSALIEAVNASVATVCAVDIPTGVDGASGRAPAAAIQADFCVTFCRRKPGHLLLPGRGLCGELHCADIGIPAALLAESGATVFANHPDLWRAQFPWPQPSGHKYQRGHLLVLGGGDFPGASRLACLAAARCGAGLVTMAVPERVWALQAGAMTSVMVRALDRGEQLAELLADTRINALLAGPGLGLGAQTRALVLQLLASRRACVLDADALSAFAAQPEELIAALHDKCVLTPHAGEFVRIFGPFKERLAACQSAAARSGCTIILKGADSVIAHPDGRAYINENAPPTLATAGSGDVLAGCVAGLLAAAMAPFAAASAAVWLHGAAAGALGWGLIADDLPTALPRALALLADMD